MSRQPAALEEPRTNTDATVRRPSPQVQLRHQVAVHVQQPGPTDHHQHQRILSICPGMQAEHPARAVEHTLAPSRSEEVAPFPFPVNVHSMETVRPRIPEDEPVVPPTCIRGVRIGERRDCNEVARVLPDGRPLDEPVLRVVEHTRPVADGLRLVYRELAETRRASCPPHCRRGTR